MTVLPLIRVPDERLRQRSKPVVGWDKKTLKLVADMVETLKSQTDPPGVGLAAVQVGVPKQIFLVRWGEKIIVVINPQILTWGMGRRAKSVGRKGKKEKEIMEGCLSVPEHFGQVERAGEVKLKYQTFDLAMLGKSSEVKLIEKVRTFKNLSAQIVQHELDHLNGVLFVEKLIEQGEKLYKLHDGHLHEVTLS